MTWPTKPISTQDLQSDAGNPTLARAAIEQMADSVSDITSTFDPDAAEQNAVLQFADTSFTSIDLGSVTDLPMTVAALDLSGGTVNTLNTTFQFGTLGGTKQIVVNLIDQQNNFVSVENNVITLQPGQYLFTPMERTIFGGPNFVDGRSVRVALGTDPVPEDQVVARLVGETGVLGGTRFFLTPDLTFTLSLNTQQSYTIWVDATEIGNGFTADDLLIIRFG